MSCFHIFGFFQPKSWYKKYQQRRIINNYIERQKNVLLKEAKTMFNSSDIEKHGSFDDYCMALERYLVSYNEYEHQYRFWEKTESERREFVSRVGARALYRLFRTDEVFQLFRNKVKFLNHFKNFIHREYFLANEVSFVSFTQFVSSRDCIAKPLDQAMGRGIFKINKDALPNDMRKFYEDCRSNNLLIEECIEGCDEIQSFHPSSLNSIRLMTLSNANKAIVFASFIRMGRGGSVVDNAHAGGIFAHIDIETGIVDSEGISTDGDRFISHPDTGKKIVGFQIPHWNELTQFCLDASKCIPGPSMTGWDVVITKNGNFEFVEGNGGPDFDVLQSPLNKGIRLHLDKSLDYVFDGRIKYPIN